LFSVLIGLIAFNHTSLGITLILYVLHVYILLGQLCPSCWALTCCMMTWTSFL